MKKIAILMFVGILMSFTESSNINTTNTNTVETSSTITPPDDEIAAILIQYDDGIDELTKNEIRYKYYSLGFLLDYEPYDLNTDIWYFNITWRPGTVIIDEGDGIKIRSHNFNP